MKRDRSKSNDEDDGMSGSEAGISIRSGAGGASMLWASLSGALLVTESPVGWSSWELETGR